MIFVTYQPEKVSHLEMIPPNLKPLSGDITLSPQAKHPERLARPNRK